MSAASIIIGVSIVVWTSFDVFRTVFVIGGGAGFQSGRFSRWVWRGALRVHRPASASSHSLLRAVGPGIVLLLLGIWLAQLILGWALVFIPQAFQIPESAGFSDRLVFAGQSVLGRNGNSPSLAVIDGHWEWIRSIAGATGVFLVSVGLAYVLPILSGVSQKRSVAAMIHMLGEDASRLRRLAATPGGSSFELHLVALAQAISISAENHRSYPVLHYFHSKDRYGSLSHAIAVLAEFLQQDLDGLDKVDDTVTEPLCRAIHNLLEALERLGLREYADINARIDTVRLHPVGVNRLLELSRTGESNESDAMHEASRTVLGETPLPANAWFKSYLMFDGWPWDDVDGRPG